MPRHFTVTVNGVDYKVDVEELNAPAAATVAASAPVAAAPAPAPVPTPASAVDTGTDVLAQMGGVIHKVLVSQGQAVSEGDRLIELEAMKMKIPVLAPCSGKVTRILGADGDPVEIGQPMISVG